MQFSNISYNELAKIFVYSKKEKIEKLLGVKKLDIYTAINIVSVCLKKQGDIYSGNNQNKYSPLFDEVFFYVAIDELKNAQSNGLKLEAEPGFCEPNIMYVS